MDASKLKFKVCGMGPKPFFILFAVVLIAVYGNFMPLAKIYSNASGNFVVSSYVLTVAFLMAMGGLFLVLCQMLGCPTTKSPFRNSARHLPSSFFANSHRESGS